MITGYKAFRDRPLPRGQSLSNKALAAVRAPVEHGFAHLKNWRALGKVRTDPRAGDCAGASPAGPDEPGSRPLTGDLHRSHPPAPSVSAPTLVHTRPATCYFTMHTAQWSPTRGSPPTTPRLHRVNLLKEVLRAVYRIAKAEGLVAAVAALRSLVWAQHSGGPARLLLMAGCSRGHRATGNILRPSPKMRPGQRRCR